jgi:nicotinamidase/pyrazinamidase
MSKLMYLGIDNQDGFREGGNLAVAGGTKCGDLQAEYLSKNGNKYAAVGETVDWHPSTHCSFKENGGIWPNHCEQFTKDAAIYQPLYDVMKTCPNFTVFTKGCDEDHEEYSVFKNEESRKKILAIVEAFGIEEIHVGGIAYNYCVSSTVKDGLRYLPNVKFVVFKDFCPAIPDGTENEFTEFIANTERVELV